jgi:hypothetical protein
MTSKSRHRFRHNAAIAPIILIRIMHIQTHTSKACEDPLLFLLLLAPAAPVALLLAGTGV